MSKHNSEINLKSDQHKSTISVVWKFCRGPLLKRHLILRMHLLHLERDDGISPSHQIHSYLQGYLSFSLLPGTLKGRIRVRLPGPPGRLAPSAPGGQTVAHGSAFGTQVRHFLGDLAFLMSPSPCVWTET